MDIMKLSLDSMLSVVLMFISFVPSTMAKYTQAKIPIPCFNDICDATHEFCDDVMELCNLCGNLCGGERLYGKSCAQLCPYYRENIINGSEGPNLYLVIGVPLAVVAITGLLILVLKKRIRDIFTRSNVYVINPKGTLMVEDGDTEPRDARPRDAEPRDARPRDQINDPAALSSGPEGMHLMNIEGMGD